MEREWGVSTFSFFFFFKSYCIRLKLSAYQLLSVCTGSTCVCVCILSVCMRCHVLVCCGKSKWLMTSLWKLNVDVSILSMWQCGLCLVTVFTVVCCLSLFSSSFSIIRSVFLFIFTLSQLCFSTSSPLSSSFHSFSIPQSLWEYHTRCHVAIRNMHFLCVISQKCHVSDVWRRGIRDTRGRQRDWVNVRGFMCTAAEEWVCVRKRESKNRRTCWGDWGTHMLPLSWLLSKWFCRWQARIRAVCLLAFVFPFVLLSCYLCFFLC